MRRATGPSPGRAGRKARRPAGRAGSAAVAAGPPEWRRLWARLEQVFDCSEQAVRGRFVADRRSDVVVLAQGAARGDYHALSAEAACQPVAAQLAEADPEEVGLAVGHVDAQFAQLLREDLALARDAVAPSLDLA